MEYPERASARQTASPMRLAPPVTSATFCVVVFLAMRKESGSADQAQELGPRGALFTEQPQHARGRHDGILLLHPAHHHTQMPRLDDNPDPFGADLLHERLGDLPCEVLLHLQAAGKNIDHPRDLG